MFKYLTVLSIFVLSLNLYSDKYRDVLLVPAGPGQKSRIESEKEVENYVGIMEPDSRYTQDVLMYYNMGADTSSHYTWTSCCSNQADTFMVWFHPTGKCSLLYYRVYAHNYFDSLNTQEFHIFCAELDQSIDYYNDFDGANWLAEPCASPYPYSPIDSIVSEKICSIPGGNWHAYQCVDTLDPPHDFESRIFGVGFIKPAGHCSPNPAFWVNFSGAPLPTHSLVHGDTACATNPGWYIWHSTTYGAPLCMFAMVRYYEGDIFIESCENSLSDTYLTDSRKVHMHITDFGLPPDSSGIFMDSVLVRYVVNSVDTFVVYADSIRGDSVDAYFVAQIPGQTPGDTVVYWVEATNLQGQKDYGVPGSYVIRQGDPGDFLYIRDDYAVFDGGDIAPILPGYYEDTVDVWDTKTMGPPDSSVFAYYTHGDGYPAVVIRSWGVGFFNNVDYGMAADSADLNYPCSTYAKELLNNGGCFWLSDQDMGAGLGICPDYGHGNATGWVRNYLGAQGMYDDDAQLGGICLPAYSAGNPILDDLFSGIGYQDSGKIYIAPYVYFDPTMAWSYTGSYDSLMTGTVQNMFDVNGRVFSYAWGNPSNNSKVWMDFWAWDYIANPADSIYLDTTAVDTLVFDVLDWFGIGRTGLGGEISEIEDTERPYLYSISPVNENAVIRYYLPEEMRVSVNVYDLTGRKLKNLVDERKDAGINSFAWNCRGPGDNRIPAGIYFVRLSAKNERLTQKMVVLK